MDINWKIEKGTKTERNSTLIHLYDQCKVKETNKVVLT